MMRELLKMYKKQIIFGSVLMIGAAWFVYAQVLIALVNVTPPGNCRETDGGYNINMAGCISGNFTIIANSTNITFSGTFCDACTNSTSNSTLIEFVCGGSVAPQFSGLAGAFAQVCPRGCSNGRCL